MRLPAAGHELAACRGNAISAFAFVVITALAWFAVPPPRWALVTLGAFATLLLIAVGLAAFPVSRRVGIAATATAFVCHVLALVLSLDTPPTLTQGDPPGRMLSSITIQSPTHEVRYRVPLPGLRGDWLRVKLLLAKAYAGPALMTVNLSGRAGGAMKPAGGNLSELEHVFDATPFREVQSVLLTIRQDAYDPELRLAVWKSGLGRAIPDVPEYATEHGVWPGLPDPLTGAMGRAWPVAWVTGT